MKDRASVPSAGGWRGGEVDGDGEGEMSEPKDVKAEVKHTPGPWEIDNRASEFGPGRLWIVETNGPKTICGGLGGWPNRVEESRANAHLIAAAPEMYAVLRSVVGEMRREHDMGDEHFSTAQVEAAEAALAKAEGRS